MFIAILCYNVNHFMLCVLSNSTKVICTVAFLLLIEYHHSNSRKCIVYETIQYIQDFQERNLSVSIRVGEIPVKRTDDPYWTLALYASIGT